MQLQGNQGSSGASAAKWTDEEVKYRFEQGLFDRGLVKISQHCPLQVEMLHRAVRNFSQDLQVELLVYQTMQKLRESKEILGDLRDDKGEDCTTDQDCATEESI